MEQVDIAILVVRVWLGIVMIMHGVNHGRTLDGTARWFESVGFRSAALNARVSALSEVAIGMGLAVGLLTSPAVAGLVATMFVAFWSIHRFAGFFNFHRPDEGYEYVTTLAVVAAAVAVIGPGELSLDAVLGIADDLDGVTGGLIALAGVVAGAAQVAVFWRRPSKESQSNA